MKKVLTALMILVLSIGLSGITAYADSTTDATAKTQFDNAVQTRIVHSYAKSVDRYYDRSIPFTNLPASIDYSEFNEEYHTTFSGTLFVDSIVTHGYFWKVTYKGTLVGLL